MVVKYIPRGRIVFFCRLSLKGTYGIKIWPYEAAYPCFNLNPMETALAVMNLLKAILFKVFPVSWTMYAWY